jgi:hypothetical protein
MCQKYMYLVTDEKLYMATIMYPHLTHKILSLYNADLPMCQSQKKPNTASDK